MRIHMELELQPILECYFAVQWVQTWALSMPMVSVFTMGGGGGEGHAAERQCTEVKAGNCFITGTVSSLEQFCTVLVM